MKSKIENFYIEQLWDFIQNNNYLLYKINSYYQFNVISKENLYLLENSTYLYGIQKELHIKSIKSNLLNNKEAFVKEISKAKLWFINGDFNTEDFFINFFIDLNIKNKKDIGKILQKFNQDKRFNFFNVNEMLFKKLNTDEFVIWWNALPINVLNNAHYKNELQALINFVEKYIDINQQHNYIKLFINKRAKLLSKSEKKALYLRDLLLKKYKNNPNLLNDYKKDIKIIDMYLKTLSDNNYLEDRIIKENFYIEINYEKLKSVLAIPKWTKYSYKKYIKILMDILYQENEEIKNIKQFNEKDIESKEDYLSIYIAKSSLSGITKKEIEEYIKIYLLYIKNNYLDLELSPNKIDYIKKWYLMEKLNKNLKIKYKSSIIEKI